MSEKREFPILNGKLLSDLDLNGYKLIGLDISEGGGGGGPSVEVVAPSPDGAGKAADAAAVYEALEKKRDKTDLTVSSKEWGDVECSTSLLDSYIETFRPKFENGAWTTSVNGVGIWGVISVTGAGGDSADSVMVQLRHGIEGYTESITYHRRSITTTLATLKDIPDALSKEQMEAVNSGVTKDWKEGNDEVINALQQDSTYQAGLIDKKMPLYITVSPVEVDGRLHLYPFGRNEVSATLEAMTIAEVIRNTSDGSVSFGSGIMLDCSLVIDCRGRDTAPTITWPDNIHPRMDVETDFACVAGVRNVYWITEYAPNEFVVAGWQETTGRNAQ